MKRFQVPPKPNRRCVHSDSVSVTGACELTRLGHVGEVDSEVRAKACGRIEPGGQWGARDEPRTVSGLLAGAWLQRHEAASYGAGACQPGLPALRLTAKATITRNAEEELEARAEVEVCRACEIQRGNRGPALEAAVAGWS